MARVTLPNGMIIEGTPQQIRETLSVIGAKVDPKLYYLSESHGEYLLIRGMNDIHLRNATLKMQEEWLKELRKITDPHHYALAVATGIEDPTFIAMMQELYSRFDNTRGK